MPHTDDRIHNYILVRCIHVSLWAALSLLQRLTSLITTGVPDWSDVAGISFRKAQPYLFIYRLFYVRSWVLLREKWRMWKELPLASKQLIMIQDVQPGGRESTFCFFYLVDKGVTRGYKDGLQPESLADGKLAGETKSTSVENWN